MKMTTRIAFDNLKYHKSRNILTGIAIFLATLLLFVVPTVGYDLVSVQYAMINKIYPTWQALYRNVNEDTAEQLAVHHDISAYGLRSDAGIWVSGGQSASLYYLDEKAFEMYRMELLEGKLPEKQNEIVVSKGLLAAIGQDTAKIGDTISLSFQIERNGGLDYQQEQDFVITGFLTETEDQDDFPALISKEFLEQEVPAEQITYRFLLEVSTGKYSNTDTIEHTIKNIAAQFDIPEDDININTERLSANYVDPTFVPVIIGLMLIIVFAGIITIYSIYYVSVTPRIQEFGRLKAIGASKKQIRQILLREGMLAALCAIPIGLLAGTILVKFVLLEMFTMYEDDTANITLEVSRQIIQNLEVSLYPWWTYPMVIVIVFLTVYIALIKPIRKMAKISVMEAIRYQENSRKKKKKKGYDYLTIARLTRINLFNHKKKSIITILSMSITGVFVMVVAAVLSSANPIESANANLVGQYTVTQNVEYGNKEHPEREWTQIQANNPLNDELKSQLEALDGVKRVDVFSEIDISGDIFEDDGSGEDICGVPEEYADEIEAGIIEGKASYEDLKSGDAVIADCGLLYYYPDLKVGDTLHVTVHDGEAEYEKALKIIAIGDYRYGLTNYDWLIMAKEAADKLSSNNVNRYFCVIADKNYDTELDHSIENLIASNDILEKAAWQTYYEEWKSAIALTRNACFAFLGILSAICIMNLINTTINSVHLRRKEFGMMQAIGMSDKQLRQMLQLEALFYTLGTLFVSIGIGSIAGYPVYLYAKKNGMFNIRTYHYPFTVAVLVVIVLALVQMILVYALGKSLKKQSLIDRIRFSE